MLGGTGALGCESVPLGAAMLGEDLLPIETPILNPRADLSVYQ